MIRNAFKDHHIVERNRSFGRWGTAFSMSLSRDLYLLIAIRYYFSILFLSFCLATQMIASIVHTI